MAAKETIRPFNSGDWDDISRIYLQALDSDVSTFQTSCPPFEKWDTSHLPFCRFVFTSDGKVAGWLALSPISSRRIYAGVAEVSIFIEAEARGKGIGTTLMQMAIATAEENGIWTLQSNIIQENAASIALHKKCGFREVGFREKIARDRFGVWRNTVLMERRSHCIF